MRNLIAILCSLPIFLASCVDAPEYPVEPVITFEGVNKDRVFQDGIGIIDSIEIQFSFTDGDGDLSDLNGDSINMFLTNSQLGIPQAFAIPTITKEGTGNGISGDIFITVANTTGICCIFDRVACASDPRFPVDTFSYAIQIQDRAGNRSNKIQTSVIEIICLRP
ncbi:hypothetical protein [Neolewinella antarctica]|uniref:Lipoprotein n=1 Tax=Neolewinella antarctica TaxID=442734 RepID=A0ABX0XGV9_9BACT|nr:hypothetical protein [Neolewinella antarctica]NJC28116.1 hypothetical protein [Neolewinella antarctica]